MTHEEVKDVVKKHRRSAGFGTIIGLLLVLGLGGWGIARIVLTPDRPNVHNAAPAEIVRYVAHDRGLAALSQVEQEQFLQQWKDAAMGDKAHCEALAEFFEECETKTRKAFARSITRYFKRAFMGDARHYDRIKGTDEAYAFLTKKHEQLIADALFFKEVATAFRDDFDTRPEKIQESIARNSTPEERAIGEPYWAALQKVRQQLKKQGRAAVAPKSSDTPS